MHPDSTKSGISGPQDVTESHVTDVQVTALVL